MRTQQGPSNWVAMTSCWIKYFNKEWPPTWLINILHAWCIDIRPLSEIEANPEICSANQNQSAITRNNTFYAYSWTDWIINALHWASKPRRLWGWPIFFLLISLTCYLISTRNSILSWTRGDRKCKRTFINRVLCESSEESETSPSCETSFTSSLLVLSLILICNHPILYQSHPVFPYLRICQVGRECNLTVFTRVYWARSYQWTTPWGRLLGHWYCNTSFMFDIEIIQRFLRELSAPSVEFQDHKDWREKGEGDYTHTYWLVIANWSIQGYRSLYTQPRIRRNYHWLSNPVSSRMLTHLFWSKVVRKGNIHFNSNYICVNSLPIFSILSM